MRLSTKGRYAVMAMTDLALHEKGRPISLADISERQQISLSYLEQLFARLRRAELVKSARGPGGGYSLSRQADRLYVSEIILAVDEPIKATRCALTSKNTGANKCLSKAMAAREIGCMPKGQKCLTHNLWEDLGAAIHDYLSCISLEDVIKQRTQKKAAVSAPESLEPHRMVAS
jgi:Rrf2 family transcriptional regulator, iron-sulfur cluster assembly transcription factor